jgi:hypothetical protein
MKKHGPRPLKDITATAPKKLFPYRLTKWLAIRKNTGHIKKYENAKQNDREVISLEYDI